MTTYLLPHNELVMRSWLQGISGVPVNQIGTTLPGDNSAWAASGYVEISVIGGSADLYSPIRRPVFQVDCWAVMLNSSRPPWHKANQLAEVIFNHCYGSVDSDSSPQRKVVLPAVYRDARVIGARAVNEPRRVPSDEARFARYQFDLQLDWVEDLQTKVVLQVALERYIHRQLTPAAVWSVPHDLGYWPNTAVKVDDEDVTSGADIYPVTDNLLTISFSYPVAGEAVLI
jgi:hypothetical protein